MSRRPHIMIVEDDLDLQILLKNLFKADFDITLCENGLEGLKALETGPKPDLIIADIMMPLLNGLTMVDAIKKHQGTEDIPVIFLTAKSTPADVIEGINVGAKYYITKPFKIDELTAKVKRILKT
jgi:DNA-binding response OmpR family regulator